jgi:imidazolonepropionase-like amidohydrolase
MGRGLRAELDCLARSGLRPEELLTMATETAAQACETKRYTGRIAVGEPASFGLYAKAPWASVTNLNSLLEVYSHGTRISPALQNQPDAILNA